LQFGLNGKAQGTLAKNTFLAESHVIPALGSRKLRDLSAEDVDRWLADKAAVLSTSTVLSIRSILRRAVSRAQARDKVKRNVVLLCDAPKGQAGRPRRSRSPTRRNYWQPPRRTRHRSAPTSWSRCCSAPRTEELRALTWSHVELRGSESPPIPPHIMVWRSVRVGETPSAEIPPNSRVAGAGCDRVGLASDPASGGARTRRHGVV
jgi:hypothetical protein